MSACVYVHMGINIWVYLSDLSLALLSEYETLENQVGKWQYLVCSSGQASDHV